MTLAAPSTECVQTSLPLGLQTGDDNRSGTWSRLPNTKMALPTPRMIKSVVDEAGLGKFVYLQGQSGRRYVFSSIRREQAALYDQALFAVSGTDPYGAQSVRIAANLHEISDIGGSIYVHLLDDADDLGRETIEDLCGTELAA